MLDVHPQTAPADLRKGSSPSDQQQQQQQQQQHHHHHHNQQHPQQHPQQQKLLHVSHQATKSAGGGGNPHMIPNHHHHHNHHHHGHHGHQQQQQQQQQPRTLKGAGDAAALPSYVASSGGGGGVAANHVRARGLAKSRRVKKVLYLEVEAEPDLGKLQPAVSNKIEKAPLHVRVQNTLAGFAKKYGADSIQCQVLPCKCQTAAEVEAYDRNIVMKVPPLTHKYPLDVDGQQRVLAAVRPYMLARFLELLHVRGDKNPVKVCAARTVRKFSLRQAQYLNPYETGTRRAHRASQQLMDGRGGGWTVLALAGRDAGSVVCGILDRLGEPDLDLPTAIVSSSPKDAFLQLRCLFSLPDLQSMGKIFAEYTA